MRLMPFGVTVCVEWDARGSWGGCICCSCICCGSG